MSDFLKRRLLRISAILLIVITAGMFFPGCALTPFSDYENFFDDMDISVRMQDCLYKAAHEDTSAFFYDELVTFKEDLLSNPVNSEEAETVNSFFVEAVDNIIAGVDAARLGDNKKAQELFDAASLCFNNGNMRYQDFMAKYR